MVNLDKSLTGRLFDVINAIILMVFGLICIAPFVHMLALSLSSTAPAVAGYVRFWPVNFTWANYEAVLANPAFYQSFLVSVKRVVLGTFLSMTVTVLTAYPLSRADYIFKGRHIFIGLLLFALLFNGGLIPWYMIIRELKLLNTIWALVLPTALNIWNIILMTNFFKEIPKELEEAAFIDGASHWQNLWFVVLPLSVPVLAALSLFTAVGHWNSWFDGMILMSDPSNYPMQSYLRTVVVGLDMRQLGGLDPRLLALVSDRALRAAQILVSTVPILVAYPFLQKYFITGIKLGAIKE